jgi:hypothetical protein
MNRGRDLRDVGFAATVVGYCSLLDHALILLWFASLAPYSVMLVVPSGKQFGVRCLFYHFNQSIDGLLGGCVSLLVAPIRIAPRSTIRTREISGPSRQGPGKGTPNAIADLSCDHAPNLRTPEAHDGRTVRTTLVLLAGRHSVVQAAGSHVW